MYRHILPLLLTLSFSTLYAQSKLPKYSIDESSIGLYTFPQLLDEYIRHDIGILDSLIEDNQQEGEGYERSLTYNLKGGHTSTEIHQYESWLHTIAFVDVKLETVQDILVALIKQADKWTPETELSIRSSPTFEIPVEMGCCYFTLERTNDTVFLFLGLLE